MYNLKNDLLNINIKPKGVELCNITSVKNDTEFMWQADSNIWGSHAPNLFPIIGSMKTDSYFYNGQAYKMPKHGFTRHNQDFIVTKETKNTITFQLQSNPELYKIYPFLFQFELTYELKDNLLLVHHSVKNLDDTIMYFSLGGHPAFRCPLYKNEDYTDYFLEFNKVETTESYLLNMCSGLVTSKTKPVFTDRSKIRLSADLFNEDALIFKDLKSRKVTLKHQDKGPILSVTFEDFPYLGIWAKPKAPYVCIEPWLGIADSETTNQKIVEKEGIIALDSGSVFNASYSIEIEMRHLV